ncbi:MAG: hypothetical protein GY783_19665, partial [Gammaproteobacteria bacterium]|nr:hypothetical protein [Gammaproteobacteria bacterium]
MAPRRIIIDCDPGQDDAVALFLAMSSPDELQILGITTVAGNVPLKLTQRNARMMCDIARRRDIPVFAGCERPMVREAITAEFIHGNTGIDRVAATGQDGQVTDGQEFGANDWIEVEHDTSLDLTDSMTISFWIKPTSDSGTFNRVVEKGLWGYNDSYYFGGGNGTNDLTFYLNGQEVFDTPDNVLTVGEWQHAAVSYTSNGDG